MIAHEDDIVTCERGHPLYRITRDVQAGSVIRSDQFEALHPRAQEPRPLAVIWPCCPMCGTRWMAVIGLHGYRHIHFEDGWRPRLAGEPANHGDRTMTDQKPKPPLDCDREGALALAASLSHYQSSKVVAAAKILMVKVIEGGDVDMVVSDAGSTHGVRLSAASTARYLPIEGDWLMIYQDGYVSISPKPAFEDGYTLHTD